MKPIFDTTGYEEIMHGVWVKKMSFWQVCMRDVNILADLVGLPRLLKKFKGGIK